MNSKFIKEIGFAATIVGFGASMASDWANEKKMEEEIDKKVEAAFSEREKNEEENES